VKFQGTKKYNPEIQIWAIRQRYPQFKIKKRGPYDIEFTGDLVIKPELPVYTVSIAYMGNERPAVKVLKPELVEKPPHVYPGKELCLYHPSNFHWTKEKLIAREIVDWTITWIYFYEVWLQTRIWYGPEVEHTLKN
jgi:hypothetical protein